MLWRMVHTAPTDCPPCDAELAMKATRKFKWVYGGRESDMECFRGRCSKSIDGKLVHLAGRSRPAPLAVLAWDVGNSDSLS